MSDHTSPTRWGSAARRIASVAAFCLLISACSSDAADDSASTVAEATTTSAADEGSERTLVTADDSATDESATDESAADEIENTTATTDAPPDSTTSTTAGEAELAGEALDFGPSAGTPLAIVGVAYDDTLNFRVDPSPDADILESFGPLSGDLDTSALGSAWAAPSGVWWMVDVAGTEAWANQAFLGSLGTTTNAFDQLSAELEIVQYDTVEAAALAVAQLRATEDPESSIVFAGEPLAFETGGFAIVDVLGFGDDSVKGERIRVEVRTVFDEESGEEGAQDVDHFVIVDIEITPICGRGLSGGLCV